MFSDFYAVCWDIVVNEIAKSRYMTNGQVAFPLVIKSGNGGGLRFGTQHSQAIENWAMAVPGLKVVAPSTPEDAMGLMAAAVRRRADALDAVEAASRALPGWSSTAPRPGRRSCAAPPMSGPADPQAGSRTKTGIWRSVRRWYSAKSG
ncbi:hypothetical protein [Spirillospora sp. CA-294931]|uniref:hypothetical protein n=1 Tax=Spirillospora sp. CA-294931 TaxID=3240042 RepID=UPI003D944256